MTDHLVYFALGGLSVVILRALYDWTVKRSADDYEPYE